ncbi:MAG: hypothetical protein FWF36_10430 [Propionibacteriaceae bacterium]|nr:hypothetical protein [Propionibacteriaceae bacterium]
MSVYALFIAVFLACLVEAVEATTIVVAAGATRNWRSALTGTVVAFLVLCVIVAVLGPSIMLLPIWILRTLVGGLLLIFGLQWMIKAIMRASGFKSRHDETAIYQEKAAEAKNAAAVRKLGVADWYAFTLAFKGVLLEGLEVVFIVLTFATNDGHLPVALIAAGLAILIIVGLGVMVRGPLSRIPENTLKFVVSILLITFGVFWAGEGVGARWPASDAALLVVAPCVAVFALILTWLFRRAATRRLASQTAQASPTRTAFEPAGMPARKQSWIMSFGKFWYDFIIGDDWQIAAGVFITLVVLKLGSGWSLAWVIAILGVVILVPYGSWRVIRTRL